MSDVDLVIRNGTIYDGTGGDPFQGDVAIAGDRIVAIGKFDGQGAEEIDATGMIVTSGFVDTPTHSDGQAIWSSTLLHSNQHGVTTDVVGNWGVGFAPCCQVNKYASLYLLDGGGE